MFQPSQQINSPDATERIAFFLVPKFSMIAFTAALEALRLANRLSGKGLYSWHVVSKDGKPVEASNGLVLMADLGLDALDRFPTVILCSGIDAHLYRDESVFARLRRLARQGVEIGAVCTGSHVLARAGLLEGYRCTIHWENLGSFTEEFPDIEVSSELIEVDRDRFTCAGGIAAADLMLHAIAQRHGQDLAAAISDQFILDRIRDPHDPQRVPLRARLGIGHPKLVEVVAQMEASQEEPLAQDHARPLLSQAPPYPGAAAIDTDDHGRDRRGARLRLRLGLAFLEMLPRLPRPHAARGAAAIGGGHGGASVAGSAEAGNAGGAKLRIKRKYPRWTQARDCSPSGPWRRP
jgi:transcriptional regulator GlxA family with amidase domain